MRDLDTRRSLGQYPLPMVEGQLGPFSILRRISSGDQNEILLARRKGPGGFSRLIVLKRLHPRVETKDSAIRALLDEAHLQGLVIHPNVVPVHEVLVLGGRYHVVMDWVDGVNVADVIDRCTERGGPVPAPHALFIAQQVARGLHAAHTARDHTGSPTYLVHRDVCPRNILVGWNGSVRLTDFGISQAARRLTQTQIRSVKGTPGYLSPEQASLAEVDPLSDIFSLGATLFHMLTGSQCVEGRDAAELIQGARDFLFTPPSAATPGLPGGLDKLLEGMMARLPRQRMSSAREVEAALGRFRHDFEPGYTSADLPGFLAAIFPEADQGEDSANTDVYRRPKD